MLLFDILYFIVIVLSVPFWGKMLFKKEYRTILKHRFLPDLEENGQKHIWLHAVSVGEVKSIKNLIYRLKNGAGAKIVLTVTTPTGYAYAKKEYKDIEVINAPFDFSFVVNKFIQKINPKILVLNELEIWPNWVLMMKKRGIPILLINGRISDGAFKHYRRYMFFFKKFFYRIDYFLIQAEIYKKKFAEMGIPAERIGVCGNIKADEAWKSTADIPPKEKVFAFLKAQPPQKRVLTLASSHYSDEKKIIPIWQQFERSFSFIIVPRHIDRTAEIEKILRNNNIKYRVWSQTSQVDLDREVLIFDRIGYLVNILSISDLVLMGGTFEKKIGSHNLYEPAALGKFIIGGPHYNNFPDIGRELVKNGVYRVTPGHRELADTLRNIDQINFDDIRTAATRSVSKRKGSTECILGQIQRLAIS
jgi:3-deoxy-D-manno-octulosonic-acid transferase